MNLEYKIKPTAMILFPPMHSIWRDIDIQDIVDFGFDFENYSLKVDGVIFESPCCRYQCAIEKYKIWHRLSKD